MSKELPSYVSHKVVQAAKIINIVTDDASACLHTEHGDIVVDGAYVMKHQPQSGGYYVLYADGYESWSPAEAFEDGYTPLDEVEPAEGVIPLTIWLKIASRLTQQVAGNTDEALRVDCLKLASALPNNEDADIMIKEADKLFKFVRPGAVP